MALQFMYRFAVVVFIVLSLGFLVHASPLTLVASPMGEVSASKGDEMQLNCFGDTCFGGLKILPILLRLRAAIEIQLQLLGKLA